MATGRSVKLGVLLLAVVSLSGCQRTPPTQGTELVVIAGEQFHLEVARDSASRTQGLMGRTKIASDGGMLFIFPTSQVQRFWMGYCLVDMDIMYLDPNGRVTAFYTMKTEAPRTDSESESDYSARMKGYPSVYAAQFVIELRAGTLKRLGVEVDDKIELDLARLKAMAQ